MKVGIIAALPGELRPLIRGWTRVKTATPRVRKWTLQRGEDTWVAVCAGMGADAARKAFAEAERDAAMDMVLSVGWAGALHDEIKTGTAQILNVVVDAQTGEQFGLIEPRAGCRLVTSPRVADVKEKMRLAETYPGAVMVDMEGATVARLAAMRGIPLLCIKGVSDEAKAELPDLNLFIHPNGHLRMLSFLCYLALRPRYWLALFHLGRNSSRSAEAMRDLVLELMKEQNGNELIRSGNG